jgi:hypothetical protein
VVIQPNVVTTDHTAGVQTGEMVLITDTGVERMHTMPRGFVQIDRLQSASFSASFCHARPCAGHPRLF